ncbi:efflux transporter periplasmic adaptor subunit [Rhodospirillum rubrum]|uniref:efflux RND transporter periplasmic adaptor subunit n=1 Tax=Rhodospirillum rubrum TaxID=1085 RepID=UPI001908DB54|nr:efflux RND transporter periplasmic adaptor subunit [Rhodospirillum rubrum]MBK1665594.1 efflux transporter periplasmic adaptor subunit [Rhodospirillum rubrum]MBK1677660.1 efflux transporter periplasmic adaptor subunit [Rhodospirillum rubrum]
MPPPPASRPRRPSRRTLVLILGLLAVCALGAWALGWFGANGDKAPPPRHQTVELGTVENAITAVGSLQPKTYVDVGAQVSGKVSHLPVAIGDRVEKGDLLTVIDPRTYEARVRTDKAALAKLHADRRKAEAQLALSRQQRARTERLFQAKATSQDSLDSARTTVLVDQAAIESIDAQIEQALAELDADQADLDYTQVYATMSGTIVSIAVVEGQTLNSVQSAPDLMRIADLDTMTVKAEVAEADITAIKPGMPGYFTTLGGAGRRWQGTVRLIEPTPVTDNDVVLYNVLMDVANPDGALMTDMTAQVFFLKDRAENVPVVPLAALTPTATAGTWTASVQGPGGLEQRTVTTGVVNRALAQVVDGLAVGDKVVPPRATPGATTGGFKPPPML